MDPLVAVLVGGAGRRMGGVAKGLLVTPSGETIVARLTRVVAEAGLTLVLVGAHPAYAGLGLPSLPDEEAGSGPLGGLVAGLAAAGDRPLVALAADLPYVSAALLERLVRAPPGPLVVAPSVGGIAQPLFARYDAPSVLPLARARLAGRRFALRGLLDLTGVTPLTVSLEEEAELRDWDTPEDRG